MWDSLKTAIAQIIKANGQQDITGVLLQQELFRLIDSVGAGFMVLGVATPTTDPGTPDSNVCYFATTIGVYPNFSNLNLAEAGLKLLYYSPETGWSYEVIYESSDTIDLSDYYTKEEVDLLIENIGGLDATAIHTDIADELSGVTAKTTPVDADITLIEDSADSGAKKIVTWANIKATLKAYFDTIYATIISVFNVLSFNATYTPTGSEAVGSVYYDPDNHCVSIVYENGVRLQVGMESLEFVTDEGNDFFEGAAVSVKGVTGNRVACELTDFSASSTNHRSFIGLLTSAPDSGNRFVLTRGAINGINTIGGLSYAGLETWVENNSLWGDPVHAGYMTNVEPTSALIHKCFIGKITVASATVGRIHTFYHHYSSASEIAFNPVGTIQSTTVQAAIEEIINGVSPEVEEIPNSYTELSTPVGTVSATLEEVTALTTTITLTQSVPLSIMLSFEAKTQSGSSQSILGVAVQIDSETPEEYQRYLSGASDTGIGAIIHRSNTALSIGEHTVRVLIRRVSGTTTPGLDRADLLVMAMQGVKGDQGEPGEDGTVLSLSANQTINKTTATTFASMWATAAVPTLLNGYDAIIIPEDGVHNVGNEADQLTIRSLLGGNIIIRPTTVLSAAGTNQPVTLNFNGTGAIKGVGLQANVIFDSIKFTATETGNNILTDMSGAGTVVFRFCYFDMDLSTIVSAVACYAKAMNVVFEGCTCRESSTNADSTWANINQDSGFAEGGRVTMINCESTDPFAYGVSGIGEASFKNSSTAYTNDATANVIVLTDQAGTGTNEFYLDAYTVSNETSSGGQLNARSNFLGTIYWVVMTSGATAPTQAELIAGVVAGDLLDSGTISVTSGNVNTVVNDSITGLSAETDYDVYLIAGDVFGRNFSAMRYVELTTIAASDTTPPTEGVFDPADSDTDVAINSNITITFAEVVLLADGSAINNTNVDSLITLKEDDALGADIAFDATVDTGSGYTVITINPTSDLPNSQAVYVAISPVEDASGNENSGGNATFTTISASITPIAELDASIEASFTKDASEYISLWEDQQNSNDAENTDVPTTYKPTWDEANSQVDFDWTVGSYLDWSVVNALLSESADFTLIAKINIPSTAINGAIVASAVDGDNRFSLCLRNAYFVAGAYDGIEWSRVTGDATIGNHTLTAINNAGVMALRIDGTTQSGEADNPISHGTTGLTLIGATATNGTGFNLNGSIYSIKLFNQVLTGTDLTDAEA